MDIKMNFLRYRIKEIKKRKIDHKNIRRMLTHLFILSWMLKNSSGKYAHCVKSVQIRSFFWSVFSRTRAKYGDLLRKSPHSARVRESKDQKKLRIWTLHAAAFIVVNENTRSNIYNRAFLRKIFNPFHDMVSFYTP